MIEHILLQSIMSFDLAQYTNGVNVIEVYLCRKNKGINVFDVTVDQNVINNIENKFKNPKKASYKSYYMKDKVYTYELSNDNQIVHSKYKVKHEYIPRDRKVYDVFVVASKIEKFPPYLFPCTNEIDHVSSYTIKEFKINNRISIMIRSEDDIHTVYIEYKHSQNVELDKMNETINRLIKTL